MRYRSVILAVAACLLCFLLPVASPHVLMSTARAETIARIVVEGNQRIEPETVTSYMHISPGEPFDPEKIDQSLKTLFQTGLFSDVRIFRRGNGVYFR